MRDEARPTRLLLAAYLLCCHSAISCRHAGRAIFPDSPRANQALLRAIASHRASFVIDEERDTRRLFLSQAAVGLVSFFFSPRAILSALSQADRLFRAPRHDFSRQYMTFAYQ